MQQLLLLVLPQEAGSRQPAIRPERRRAYAAELRAAAPDALALLGQLYAAAAAEPAGTLMLSLCATALEAYAAWVWLGAGGGGEAAPPVGDETTAIASVDREMYDAPDEAPGAVRASQRCGARCVTLPCAAVARRCARVLSLPCANCL